MAEPSEDAVGPIAARMRQSWWWVHLLFAALVIAFGAVTLVATAATMLLLPVVMILMGVSSTVSAVSQYRWKRDLPPVLAVTADGMSIVEIDLAWREIETLTVLGPGWAIFGLRRARLAVVSTGAIRFARRTRRRPDRILVPLSDLDRSETELVTALRRFAPSGVFQD